MSGASHVGVELIGGQFGIGVAVGVGRGVAVELGVTIGVGVIRDPQAASVIDKQVKKNIRRIEIITH